MKQQRWLFIASILTVVMLGCAQGFTAQSAQQELKKLNPFTGNEVAIKEGRQLYLQSGCPGCHGSGGGGAMAGATSLLSDSWKFGGDDETYFNVIKGIYPGQTMPAVFGTILTDEQIWKTITWIRSIYKGDPDRIVW